jgi:hypothetical protein
MKTGILLMAMSLPLIQGCTSTPSPARATLRPALAPLAGFIGSRRCAGTFLKSGKAITSSETVAAELSGYWLTLRHTDTPPFPFQALELWGYDDKAGHFVAYIYDNFGGVREFASPGWDGDSFTWTDVDTSMPKRDRFVFERQPAGGYRFTYEVSGDGVTWTGVDRLTCAAR